MIHTAFSPVSDLMYCAVEFGRPDVLVSTMGIPFIAANADADNASTNEPPYLPFDATTTPLGEL